MRLSYMLELVLAVGVGLGLARFRLGNPEWHEIRSTNWYWWALNVSDSILAGAFLIGGLGTLTERLRGKSPEVWGPGRWAWVSLAALVILTKLDDVLGSIRVGWWAFLPRPLVESVKKGLCEQHHEYLPSGTAMVLLAFEAAWSIAPSRQRSKADARERAGRVFASLLVVSMLVFRALYLFDYISLMEGSFDGGMGNGIP